MTDKWALFFDIDKCSGCRNCFIAVKDEYVGNDRPGYFAAQPPSGQVWFGVDHHETGQAPFTEVSYLLRTCQHCDEAPCMKAASGGAVVKRADGIVVIDPGKAHGQKQIAEACPYGAVSWNEETQLPQAWPFDAHLFDEGWTKTRAEQVCASGALRSEKMSEATFEGSKTMGWRQLRPELRTRPRVLYRGLDRIETLFVAGSVEIERDGLKECFEGATVEWLMNGSVVASVLTDCFGDFKIKGLPPGAAGVLRIGGTGFRAFERAVDLKQSVSLGRILVAAA